MPIEYDFEASVGYWVHIAALAFRRAMNEELAPLGITHRQMQVLAWLVLETELSQGELACRMDVEPSTLAGLIDRMEAAGWIRRTSCPHDRRKKLVKIEPAAEPIWGQIADSARRVRADATLGLSEQEAAALRSALSRIHQNLSQRGAPTIRSPRGSDANETDGPGVYSETAIQRS